MPDRVDRRVQGTRRDAAAPLHRQGRRQDTAFSVLRLIRAWALHAPPRDVRRAHGPAPSSQFQPNFSTMSLQMAVRDKVGGRGPSTHLPPFDGFCTFTAKIVVYSAVAAKIYFRAPSSSNLFPTNHSACFPATFRYNAVILPAAVCGRTPRMASRTPRRILMWRGYVLYFSSSVM